MKHRPEPQAPKNRCKPPDSFFGFSITLTLQRRTA